MNTILRASGRCALLSVTLALTTSTIAWTRSAHTVIKTYKLLDSGATVITDASNVTLYASTGDQHGQSSCYGSCSKIWKPLLASGKLVAGKGVNAKLLGTTTRRDGKRQVTYAGHPLYLFMYFDPYFHERTAETPGDDYGQACGAKGDHDGNSHHPHWWIVAPSGNTNTRLRTQC